MFNTGFIALTLKKFQINVFASKPKKVVGQNIWALKIPPIIVDETRGGGVLALEK